MCRICHRLHGAPCAHDRRRHRDGSVSAVPYRSTGHPSIFRLLLLVHQRNGVKRMWHMLGRTDAQVTNALCNNSQVQRPVQDSSGSLKALSPKVAAFYLPFRWKLASLHCISSASHPVVFLRDYVQKLAPVRLSVASLRVYHVDACGPECDFCLFLFYCVPIMIPAENASSPTTHDRNHFAAIAHGTRPFTVRYRLPVRSFLRFRNKQQGSEIPPAHPWSRFNPAPGKNKNDFQDYSSISPEWHHGSKSIVRIIIRCTRE